MAFLSGTTSDRGITTGKESKLEPEAKAELTFNRISIDPRVCHGQACVAGTRIPVHQVVRMLANGDTVESLLADYPALTREDIKACLEYAAELAEEQVTPIEVPAN